MSEPITPIKKDGTSVEEYNSLVLQPGNHQPGIFGASTRSVSADLGYRIIGPLCYGFATWVAAQARAAGIRHLFFLSRDGWLLKKAFDLLPDKVTEGITSHYLYSSRRAVWFASLGPETEEAEFNEILSGASPYVPVGAFLSRIFLDPTNYRDEIQKAGFADETVLVDTASDRRKLHQLFRALRPDIEAKAAQEREDYLAYLKHAGFFEDRKVALADVGWTGSVLKYTRALAKRVDPEMDVHAYFLGVGGMAERKYGFTKGTCLHGYLFDFDDDTHRQILKSFYVIEKFLSPNDPSFIKITRNGKGFKPVYKKGPQEASPINFIVQNNALRFVKERAGSAQGSEHLDTETFIPALKKLLTKPDPRVARLLSSYCYSSDFGYQVGPKPIAYSRSTSTYLRNPLLLLKDYRKSRWKAGFVAQQPLPAKLILKVIRATRLDRGFEKLLVWMRKMR